jgi:hypothetical protein
MAYKTRVVQKRLHKIFYFISLNNFGYKAAKNFNNKADKLNESVNTIEERIVLKNHRYLHVGYLLT